TVVGRVVRVRGDSVDLASSVGPIGMSLVNVRSARAVDPEDFREGEYWFPNPNRTRLLFAPTARMLKQGTGYFADHMLFFPAFAAGVTDRVTIGAGMSTIPGVALEDQLFYLTPKVGLVSRKNVDVAVGALLMRPGSEDESLGIAYGVTTLGGPHGGLTAGLGFGYVGARFSDKPVVMLGGDVRLSPRFGLVSENYVVPGAFDGAVTSLGARFFGEKLAVDLGFFRPFSGDEEDTMIPFVGFVVNF
ncbi:MAG TPA: hypothetical protein VFV33_07785, partial [Gemmatimonadaceae bacterium]|nr:hypothetical protein [Gemmatimonadaceae bacterium]